MVAVGACCSLVVVQAQIALAAAVASISGAHSTTPLGCAYLVVANAIVPHILRKAWSMSASCSTALQGVLLQEAECDASAEMYVR